MPDPAIWGTALLPLPLDLATVNVGVPVHLTLERTLPGAEGVGRSTRYRVARAPDSEVGSVQIDGNRVSIDVITGIIFQAEDELGLTSPPGIAPSEPETYVFYRYLYPGQEFRFISFRGRLAAVRIG